MTGPRYHCKHSGFVNSHIEFTTSTKIKSHFLNVPSVPQTPHILPEFIHNPVIFFTSSGQWY